MRILQDIRSQRSLINLYWKEGRKILLRGVQPVLQRAERMNPYDLKNLVRSVLLGSEMEDYLQKIWIKTGSQFAFNTAKKISSKKADGQLLLWEATYRPYAYERSAKIVGKILDTEAQLINNILERYIAQGEAEGLGIQEISRRMRSNLMDDMITMQRYEAERIARTEVIGASNKGSFDGAVSTGVDVRKFWMTSGLPGVRPSHATFESLGPVDMKFEYVPGLKHPGDPSGPADEIINCRCVVGYET